MNKIIVNRNKICNQKDCNVEIKNNRIIFKNSGNYYLEYIDSNNVNLEIVVENNSVIFLLETSFDNDFMINNKYIINDGYLKVNKFYNNRRVRENINIDLRNDGSKMDYYFSNICKEEEHYKININHMNKNTISNISNKSIALTNSTLDFVINSNVRKGNNGSILNQNTRIVTFGDCNSKICPNMFIDEDDVEAKHGSIIGTFKEDAVFYLMSRGIDYHNSLKLLIKGYLFSNIMVDSDIRSKILDIIDTYWR